MKWYFAVTESSLARADHDWEGLLKAAVNSAQQNTQLRPHLLYDGEPNAWTRQLEARGVRIIPHRVSIFADLAAYATLNSKDPMWLPVASGAFMRFDIPVIEQDDDLVLYTDVDVIFLAQPNFFRTKPPLLFGASTQSTERYDDMNSGVMLINVPTMREDHAGLCGFATAHLQLGLDQEILRVYHKERYDLLDRSLNWKPYWGPNPNAQIIHFHGPKPVTVRKFLQDSSHPTPAEWLTLLHHNPEGYRHYLDLWDGYADPDRVTCTVDVVDENRIAGWAAYQRQSNKRVEFKILIDGVDDGSLVCDQPRPDVAQAGLSSGRSGFRYAPPPAPPDGAARRVEFAEHRGLPVDLFVAGRRMPGNTLLLTPRRAP